MVFVRLLLGFLLFVVSECQINPSKGHLGCPALFHSIGKKCYHFSTNFVNWFDAHYQCNQLNSSLLLITKSEDNSQLRKFLNYHPKFGKFEHWMDVRFNDKKSRWVVGSSGKPLSYQSFNRFITNNGTRWLWNCIILDPKRGNKWGADSCVEKNRYICQKNNKVWTRCQSRKQLSNSEKQLCEKIKIANTAPGFLAVKKTSDKKAPIAFICPSNMILVGRKCYFFSQNAVSWTDAHFACLQNNSKLAMINKKLNDNILRSFLNGNFIEKRERWIGGKFDEKHQRWIWAINGKPLHYQNFAKQVVNQNHTYHHITLDPSYNNQWNSRNVIEKKAYICQAKAKILKKIKPQAPAELTRGPKIVLKARTFKTKETAPEPTATIIIQSSASSNINFNPRDKYLLPHHN